MGRPNAWSNSSWCNNGLDAAVCCKLDAWHGRGSAASAVDDDALMIKFSAIDDNPLSVEYGRWSFIVAPLLVHASYSTEVCVLRASSKPPKYQLCVRRL